MFLSTLLPREVQAEYPQDLAVQNLADGKESPPRISLRRQPLRFRYLRAERSRGNKAAAKSSSIDRGLSSGIPVVDDKCDHFNDTSPGPCQEPAPNPLEPSIQPVRAGAGASAIGPGPRWQAARRQLPNIAADRSQVVRRARQTHGASDPRRSWCLRFCELRPRSRTAGFFYPQSCRRISPRWSRSLSRFCLLQAVHRSRASAPAAGRSHWQTSAVTFPSS